MQEKTGLLAKVEKDVDKTVEFCGPEGMRSVFI